jgi:hypothetical protein
MLDRFFFRRVAGRGPGGALQTAATSGYLAAESDVEADTAVVGTLGAGVAEVEERARRGEGARRRARPARRGGRRRRVRVVVVVVVCSAVGGGAVG